MADLVKRFIVFVVKSLVTICLAIIGVVSIYAQQCPSAFPGVPQLPLSECRMIANGKGTYKEKDNAIEAELRLYILGKPTDVVVYGANRRVNKDVLIMSVGYVAFGNIMPTSVTLDLKSFSRTPSKYKENHKLTIYLDDKPFLSKDAAMLGSIEFDENFSVEKFSLEMEYADFLKFTEAKQITIQMGETIIKLKSEDIEALNELNKTTKELKPLPRPYN
jgi:hypothetical protein